jgi:hypothetical protein
MRTLLFTSRAFVTGAAALIVGCVARPDAKPITPGDSVRPGTPDSAAATSATAAAVDTVQSSAGEVASLRTGRGDLPKSLIDPDTSRARLNPGRNAHDSVSYQSVIRAGRKAMANWPVGPTPLDGAVLPHRRIVAFYGNPLVKKMGVLGEYPVDEMLGKLDDAVEAWRKADPTTPVQPALHLIAVVAQGAPGRDGMYRARMDTALIEKVYGWAQRKNALLFLDVQVGHSTIQQELPRLLPFLSRPNVHLGVDPEFYMHYEREGVLPSKKVGQMDAADVNYVTRTLAKLVEEKHLPPKVFVVHRWTKKMVSNASKITLDPRVQIVMDMDGWGPPWLKFDSYRDYEVAEPVQFTGFKIFFHHDMRKGDALLTPRELLRLQPRPLYIQYQ